MATERRSGDSALCDDLVLALVLIVSNTGRGTGFGRIAAGIAKSIAVEYEVHVVGLGLNEVEETWLGHQHHILDATRTSTLATLASRLCPSLIILIGQGQLLAWQVTRLRRDGFLGAILSYVPVEGKVHSSLPLIGLEQSTTVVAYTDIGAKILTRALEEQSQLISRRLPFITTISHAIDKPLISKIEQRQQLREKLFPTYSHLSDGIWILNANRNDLRKRPELTLKAFAAIAVLRPNITLVLHCQPTRGGCDLRIERDRLGLRGRVILTHEMRPELWSDEHLVQLYTCCEIGINSCMGEGWGLVAFEHSLYGGAQILPAHEGLREIWGDAPLWVPVSGNIPMDDVFSGQIPDHEDLSIAILQLIDQPNKANQIALACATRSFDPKLGWKSIGIEWLNLIALTLQEQNSRNISFV
ncbi:glycosyltransferase family protein [Flavobacterium undicola]|uniref:glycosyltransferase n=1 Tax=Flavobacterium undicola TaxID=1932779 RepID=UPI0015E1DD7E|nr:glycosyltransferase [Flavobacterium undicola]MBA0885559.1 glycosyltransferase [Flavobacterium undicola]